MRIVVASFQVPFNRGGANFLAEGLINALQRRGHQAELVTAPFRFAPDEQVGRAIDYWLSEDFCTLNFAEPDLVIPLSFPAYYCLHSRKRVWLMHQLRTAYDLAPENMDPALRARIHELDTNRLNACEAVFTISKRVSQRLSDNNGVASTAIYHPPPGAEDFYSAPAKAFIFAPSRIETLKRQNLLVEAMAKVRSPVVAIIAGMGGQYGALLEQIRTLGLDQRVRLVGNVPQAEKIAYYANCLGVYFAPHDEDYGYVTLEAMLAEKPVITGRDSGGPLEFVIDDETGLIVEPDAQALAEAIDRLYVDQRRASAMGRAGRAWLNQLDLTWDKTLDQLLAGM